MQEESLNRDRSSGPTHDIQSLKRPALNDESSFEELVTREVGYNLQVRIFRPLKLHIRKAQLRQNVIQSFNMHILSNLTKLGLINRLVLFNFWFYCLTILRYITNIHLMIFLSRKS